MKRKLYFHIGVHRTGTTTIQHLLHKNSEQLLAQGYRFAFGRKNHTGLGWKISRGKLSPEKFINDLIADADQTRCQSMVISGEDFCTIKKVMPLKPLSEHFDVRIICYLRRQDLWLESWYNQHIRWPWNKEFSVFSAEQFYARRHDFHWIDYEKTLDRWSLVFGMERMIVRVFEPQQMAIPLENDFCQICAIKIEHLTLTNKQENVSIRPAALEFLRYLKLFNKDVPKRSLLVKSVSRAFHKASMDIEEHIFSEQRRLAILKEYESSNLQLAQRYLGREDGKLFLEPFPINDPKAPALGLPQVSELCEKIVVPLVKELLQRIERHDNSAAQSRQRDAKLIKLDEENDVLFARIRTLRSVADSPNALLKHLANKMLPTFFKSQTDA